MSSFYALVQKESLILLQFSPTGSRGGSELTFCAVLTSAFLSFAAAHTANYYHFMVTVISNLVENDS